MAPGAATALRTLHFLDEKIWFPPLEEADEEGLLAAGGDLSAERLIYAYRHGIFPWYEGQVPLWWSPDPRFVLFPSELCISKSMKQVLKKQLFHVTRDQAFSQVIKRCAAVPRPGQNGTWITEAVVKGYHDLHKLGHAHSYEAWQGSCLVGGFYGVRLGQVFFGESMFSDASNASKAAFITAVEGMKADGLRLIDCQVHTTHLESLGARFLSRQYFVDLLRQWAV